jgi:hypothetical protein
MANILQNRPVLYSQGTPSQLRGDVAEDELEAEAGLSESRLSTWAAA